MDRNISSGLSLAATDSAVSRNHTAIGLRSCVILHMDIDRRTTFVVRSSRAAV